MGKHDICLFASNFCYISIIFIYAVLQPANFSDIKCDILELRGNNYEVWKERILLHLECMDIDYAIRKDEPCITETSTPAEIALHKL